MLSRSGGLCGRSCADRVATYSPALQDSRLENATMLSLLLESTSASPFFWGFMGAALALIMASESALPNDLCYPLSYGFGSRDR